MTRLGLVISLALGAGCATTQPVPNGGPPGSVEAQGSGSGSNEECHEETSIGTTISRTVCRPKTDEPSSDARDRDTIQRQLQGGSPQRSGPSR